MGEMLKTRAKHWAPPETVHATADERGAKRVVPRERFDSCPHLTVVRTEDAQVAPLSSQQWDGPVRPSPALADSPSAIAMSGWLVQSLLVEAIVRDDAGQSTAAEQALERALELATDDRVLLPFLVDPVPELLERHARAHTAHADLISEIIDLRAALEDTTSRQASESLREPLTESELRVLRLLATDLSKREIGTELYVSVNTVKTHVKHLYAKLDVQTRRQAVERARARGLLTHSSRTR
jgi:LuxR family maltose regulon positive regulatory protein